MFVVTTRAEVDRKKALFAGKAKHIVVVVVRNRKNSRAQHTKAVMI